MKSDKLILKKIIKKRCNYTDKRCNFDRTVLLFTIFYIKRIPFFIMLII